MNPFLQAFGEADFFGKMIFFSLFILSVLSWSLLIYKIWLSTKLKKMCYEFEKIVEQKKDQPLTISDNFLKGQTLQVPYFEIYKNVKQKTVEILNKNRYFSKEEKEPTYLSDTDIDLVHTHAFTSISKASKNLERHLFILPTVTSLGPFLGILGTVWGLLLTFSKPTAQALSHSSQTVLYGLSLALTTTVIGLLVAIPALIAHNYLKSMVRDFKKDMENFSHLLLTTIEMQYRSV